MEGTGRIIEAHQDWNTGNLVLTVSMAGPTIDKAQPLRDKELHIVITERRRKRSLDANAYYWVLVGKIAEVLRVSTTEVHNHMLSDYGKPLIESGGVVSVVIRDNIDWKKIDVMHLKPTTKTMVNKKGEVYRVYFVMRGSHTYDVKEMSALIDGCISEAKQLDIETLPPEEVERMKREWGGKNERAS